MKITSSMLLNIMLLTIISASFFLVNSTASNYETTSVEYDPWRDLNDDGIINIYDVVMVTGIYGSTGTPINKTALLLELQSRMETLETRIPKKGYITISHTDFTPTSEISSYDNNWYSLSGLGKFYACAQLPDSIVVTNMTVRLTDSSDYLLDWLGVTLCRLPLDTDDIQQMVSVSTIGGGAPGTVIMYNDTIDFAEIDYQHYEYFIEANMNYGRDSLELFWVQLEYEYPT